MGAPDYFIQGKKRLEKRKRKGIQLAYPMEERRLTEAKFGWANYFPVICQPKLDGERCRAICRGHEEPILLSSTEAVITSVPHINDMLQRMCLHCELDGELYTHGEDFDSIHSIVSRTVNLHEESHKMQYYIFDTVSKHSQIERMMNTYYYMHFQDPLIAVGFELAHTFKEIMFFYEKFIKDGYEGIIVRHKLSSYERKRSRFMLKFKPKKSDVYKIIGVKQMIDKDGKLKDLLGALILTSDEGTQFSVGSGMTENFRHITWNNLRERLTLVGKYCKINYQHMTANHVPRFPVFVEILDENPEESIEDIGGIL